MNWLAVLKRIAPKGNPSILQATAAGLPAVIVEFKISSPLRQAHFLAQIAHESAGFKTTVEYASGEAYEGRKDLGNTQPSDGKRYKGRGLIQLTGRANYNDASKALGVDFVSNPKLAAQFPHALRTAGWFWSTRKLNALADRDDVRGVTKRINGGYNGLDDRIRYLERAKTAIADEADDPSPVVAQKGMATSKTGAASIATGGLATVAAGKEIVDGAKTAHEAATDATALISSVGPWVVVAIVVIGLAAFIWFDRKKKMEVFGI